ncbi:MAG: hypothetical protein AB7G40_06960 [Hyphomonadaceae bacterium]
MRTALFVVVLLFAGPAFAQATGTWRGQYYCNGLADLELQLTESTDRTVTGRFDFNVSGNRGSYEVRGRRGQDGSLELRPTRWIEQPDGFIAVGVRGVIEGDTYSGEVRHDACMGFTAQRLTQQALAEARDLDPTTFQLISMPTVTPAPPGVDPAVLRQARAIPTAPHSFVQRAALNTPETAVYVAARRRAYLVRPFVAYELPLSDAERATRTFPVYSPRDTPELTEHAALPYAGEDHSLVATHADGVETEWAILRLVRPLPGVAYVFPRFYGPPSLWAVDGYFFRNHADLQHYLKRQPPGRVVELMFETTGQNRRHATYFVVYAPLIAYSDEVRRQTAYTVNETPSFRGDVLADIVADVAAPALAAVVQEIARPRTLGELLQEAEERARRHCNDPWGEFCTNR